MKIFPRFFKKEKKKKNVLIVVTEYDYSYKEVTNLGIVSDDYWANKLIKNYYGEDLLGQADMPMSDNNTEFAFKYLLTIKNYIDKTIYPVLVYGRYFTVNDD